ncbi:hypothetical protein R7O11_31100, partial [Vibrio sp. Vb2362]|nr:hypothetical protein [Vibrio sp. Vb2362]
MNGFTLAMPILTSLSRYAVLVYQMLFGVWGRLAPFITPLLHALKTHSSIAERANLPMGGRI